MPKLKDLGINVIPETMRPPEAGPGGACGCTRATNPCIQCTQQVTVACICTELSPCGSCTQQITACICTNASPCGSCTQQLTVCACTELSPCGSCTQQITACICTDLSACGSCTQQITACICTNFSVCKWHSVCNHWTQPTLVCACSAIASICTGGSPTVITITPTTPQLAAGGGLTREHIGALREQLNQQLQALDEAEKSIGPQTLEAIDAREKEIQQEMEELKARRASLKK
jgi:hypothetical protein